MKKLQFKSLAFSFLAVVSIWFGTALAQAPIQINDASNPNFCDGSAYLLDSTANPATISWQGNGAVIEQGVYFIDSLCPGTYVLTYGSPSVTYTFTIGGNGNPCGGFYGIVTTTDVSASGVCDGTAFASAYNGTAPYTYSWSNVATTVQQGSLCEGQYDCTIVDANGCSYTATGFVSAPSTPSDSILLISNNNFPNQPVIAFYTATLEDCAIDYNLIAGATVTNVNIISSPNTPGLDTAVVTWTVTDANNGVLATYTLNYIVSDTLNGVTEFSLLLYCGQKSSDYTSMMATDRVMLGPLGINENTISNFSVVNPMGNELNIVFETSTAATIDVFTTNGVKVASSSVNGTHVSLPVSHLANGMYVVSVSANGTTTLKKVLK